jgi:hypothetical protein
MVVTTLLAYCFLLLSFLGYSSALNIQATCFSAVNFQQITQCYTPEHRSLKQKNIIVNKLFWGNIRI